MTKQAKLITALSIFPVLLLALYVNNLFGYTLFSWLFLLLSLGCFFLIYNTIEEIKKNNKVLTLEQEKEIIELKEKVRTESLIKLREYDLQLYFAKKEKEAEEKERKLKLAIEENDLFCAQKLSEGLRRSKTEEKKLLVDFGNYLLSNERKERYKKEKSSVPLTDRLSQVNDADLDCFFNK